MEPNSHLQGNRAIVDAYLERRRQGDADKIALESTLEEFCIRYPDVPRDVAKDLLDFLIAEN